MNFDDEETRVRLHARYERMKEESDAGRSPDMSLALIAVTCFVAAAICAVVGVAIGTFAP